MSNAIKFFILGWFAIIISMPFAYAMTNKECKDSGGGCMPVVSGEDANCGMCLHTLELGPRANFGLRSDGIKPKHNRSPATNNDQSDCIKRGGAIVQKNGKTYCSSSIKKRGRAKLSVSDEGRHKR